MTIHEQKNILSIPELEYYNQDFRSTLIFSPTYWFSHEKSIPKRLHLVVRYPVGADGLEVVKYLMDYRGCTVGCGAFQDTTRGEAFHAMQLLVDSMAGKLTAERPWYKRHFSSQITKSISQTLMQEIAHQESASLRH